MPDLAGTQTHENLSEAFAGASQANRRYLWFAQQADVDGYPDMATLFRSIADGETGQALGHLEYLAEIADPLSGVPIGATADNLRASIAREAYEHTEMYPSFATIARDEGFDEIAEWFDTLVLAEKHQVDKLSEGLAGL